jgi:hypothetical protein
MLLWLVVDEGSLLGGWKRSLLKFGSILRDFKLPVVLYFALGLIEKAPGARMLSPGLNVLLYDPRRLLVDMLPLSPLSPPPKTEFPMVSKGVLEVLETLPGVPYVL